MRNVLSYLLFGLASLLPAYAIVMGAFLGGMWPACALLSITVVVVLMDRFGPRFEASTHWGWVLPIVVAVAHFGALSATIWALGRPNHLDVGQSVALIVAMGLFAGQVSNACAHELIHNTNRKRRLLGTAIYTSMLNGQHVSSHLLVHHVHAGTVNDPNSAPLGQGFYRFSLRASVAEFQSGWQAESRRRQGQPFFRHPFAGYLFGAAVSTVAAAELSASAGVFTLLVISLHAQQQLMLSDYVQHYGLRRKTRSDGKFEPMGPQHSWNAPQPYSSALMMNATRHSDHHVNPQRSYTNLTLDRAEMPILPFSVPIMGAIALIPGLWRRLMDDRARAWNGPAPSSAHKSIPSFSTVTS
ncbi:MAG: alkane 1-monooxygenase [Roseobacter sp.]